MSGFKETEIGLIPEDWEISTLEKECDIIMGQSPPSSTYSKFPEGLPFYQGKADFGYLNPVKRIYCKSPIRIGEANDIIMSVRAPVGDINILIEKSCLGRGLGAIRAKAVSNFMFIYYFLLYRKEYISSLGTGSTFKSINKSQLVSLPIIKIDNAEQTKIANVLFLIQTNIIKQTQIIQNLQELKKALMQKLFTEGLNGEPLKDTDIGMIPQSWEVVTISELFKFTSGKTKPSNTTKIATDINRIPVYGGNGILGFTDSILCNTKLLILGRVGEYCGCSHLTEELSWITDNALYAKEIKKELDLEYFKYFFEYFDLNRYSNKMGQPLITQGIINQINIPYPNKSEQFNIRVILNTIDSKINLRKLKLETVQALFSSFLNQLMTGKISVKDLEI